MSRENVEIIRELLDAFERGDLEALFGHYHPDIEWDISRMALSEAVSSPVARGVDGLRAWWRDYLSAWQTVEFTYEEFVGAGDVVVVDVSQRVRGRASGIEMEMAHYAQAWTLQDGLVLRMDAFPTVAEALEAVGLSE